MEQVKNTNKGAERKYASYSSKQMTELFLNTQRRKIYLFIK